MCEGRDGCCFIYLFIISFLLEWAQRWSVSKYFTQELIFCFLLVCLLLVFISTHVFSVLWVIKNSSSCTTSHTTRLLLLFYFLSSSWTKVHYFFFSAFVKKKNRQLKGSLPAPPRTLKGWQNKLWIVTGVKETMMKSFYCLKKRKEKNRFSSPLSSPPSPLFAHKFLD